MMIILKPKVSETEKIVRAVLFGKYSNRKFLLHIYSMKTADSQKVDFYK